MHAPNPEGFTTYSAAGEKYLNYRPRNCYAICCLGQDSALARRPDSRTKDQQGQQHGLCSISSTDCRMRLSCRPAPHYPTEGQASHAEAMKPGDPDMARPPSHHLVSNHLFAHYEQISRGAMRCMTGLFCRGCLPSPYSAPFVSWNPARLERLLRHGASSAPALYVLRPQGRLRAGFFWRYNGWQRGGVPDLVLGLIPDIRCTSDSSRGEVPCSRHSRRVHAAQGSTRRRCPFLSLAIWSRQSLQSNAHEPPSVNGQTLKTLSRADKRRAESPSVLSAPSNPRGRPLAPRLSFQARLQTPRW